MFDDSSDIDRKKPSSRPARRGGSLLAIPATDRNTDPVARHRQARSRREATPGPLLAALARLEGVPVGSQPPQAPDVEPPQVEPKKPRWSLRDLLSPKLGFDPPEAKPARGAKPVVIPAAREKEAETARAPAGGAWRGEAFPADKSPDRMTERSTGDPPREAAARSNLRNAKPVVATTGDFPGEELAPVAEDTPGDPFWRPLIDPMRVIGGVVNSKALIVAATVIGAAIGVSVALSTPKKYEAFSELLVDPRDLKVSDRDLTQTGLTSDALLALVENQVRLMTSGTVLNKVVERLKLDDDPEFNGQGRSAGIGDIIGSLRALLSRSGQGGGEDNRRAIATENLSRALNVERSGRTFIVTVSAETENADKSALIVNTLDQVFLETSGELQSDTAGRAADELSARLQELRVAVERAERKVETFRAEHDLIDAQGRLITDDELIKLNDQLATARAQTLELNARAQSARSVQVDSVIGGGMPEELSSPVLSELRSQYAALKQEADRLSVRLGPRHPQYLAFQAQLKGAREQIANELRRIAASVQTQLKRAVQLEQDLAARLAQLKVRSGDLNGDLVTLRELEREAAAQRAVYENYLLRAKEAGEQRSINTANISVISQAYPPLDPSGPSRSTIAITGAMLGLLAGIAIGMARGVLWSLRDKARARRDRSTLTSDTEQKPARAGSVSGHRPEDMETSERTAAAEQNTDEADGGPLARLVERFRRPGPARTTRAAEMSHPSEDPPVSASKPEPEAEGSGRETDRSNEETATMYPYPPRQPIYPQPPTYPEQAPMQAAGYAPTAYQPYPPVAAPHYPPGFAPQAAPYPFAGAVPQPSFHGWQPQPAMTPYGYPQPVPAGAPYPAYPQAFHQPVGYPQEIRPANQPGPEPRASSPRDILPIEEVRESLREFREAIRDLVEDRARRRYS